MQDEVGAACGLAIFKHMTKCGGTALGNWLHELQVRGQYVYHSGWSHLDDRICVLGRNTQGVDGAHGNRTRRRPTSSCRHVMSQHAYILRRFGCRFAGNCSQTAGWQPQWVAPQRTPHPRFELSHLPWRAVLEVHAQDMHLSSMLRALAPSVRRSATMRGCQVLLIAVWRWPPQQYVSLYKYNMKTKRSERRTFVQFVREEANYQTRDLLRGGDGGGGAERLERAAFRTLAQFDLLAPLELMSNLTLVLCKRLGLPSCPSLRTANEANDAQFAQTMARKAAIYNNPHLRIAAQQGNMSTDAAGKLVPDHAPIDMNIYRWIASRPIERRRQQ